VTELQGIQQVFTITNDNKVHVVNVKLGPQIGQDVMIDSGLKDGDRVITDNLQKLKEGSPVSPQSAPAGPPPANTKAGN